MREYRARRKQKTEEALALNGYSGPRIEPFPPGSDRAYDMSTVPGRIDTAFEIVQKDLRIAELEAEVARLEFAAATVHLLPEEVAILGGTHTTSNEVRTTQKPGFLAAPDEDCVCGHDRHTYHLGGACSAWLPRHGKTKCPCPGFMADLGFE
jgi:hypothetical protein